MTHTKGPWRLGDGNLHSRSTIIGADGYFICSVGLTMPPRRDEDVANAHLMAAAPALLEAAGGTLAWLEHHIATMPDAPNPNDSLWRAALRAAIEEATE